MDSLAESSNPEMQEKYPIPSVRKNWLPADTAKFLAAAAGTTSNAVTRITPAARTDEITTSASSNAKRYW